LQLRELCTDVDVWALRQVYGINGKDSILSVISLYLAQQNELKVMWTLMTQIYYSRIAVGFNTW